MNRRVLALAALVALAAIPTIAAVWLAAATDDDRLLVLAPSSLAPIQAELDAGLAAAGLGPVEWSFAGSQSLVAQLADGAPADVVVTADRVSFDDARAAGADRDRYPAELSFAGNHLVLAVSNRGVGTVRGAESLADESLLIGVCASEVPCGRLAASALEAIGATIAPDTEETSARALTAKLASGELDAGLVYRTDAQAAVLTVIDVAGLETIRTTYWGLANDEGATVLGYLGADEAEAILTAAGFLP